jgi:hypothetical protein
MLRNVCDLFCILFWLFHVSVSGLLKLVVKKLMQDSIGQGVGYTHLWYSSDVLTWDIYSEVWDVVINFCCLSFVLLLCSRCSLVDMPIQQLWIVSNHSTSSGYDFMILVFCVSLWMQMFVLFPAWALYEHYESVWLKEEK